MEGDKPGILFFIGMAALLLFVASIFICFFIFIGEATVSWTEYDEVQIIGEITEVIPLEDSMIIIFDNNETYEVQYPTDTYTDLTVNSKMIITLRKYTFDGIFVDGDNEWEIYKIIKVPEVKE